MKKKIIFSLMFFLIFKVSFAYDCNTFSNIEKENCVVLNSIDENLIANLIYKNTSKPDFNFVKKYNEQIIVTVPPEGTIFENSGTIQNAWIIILTIDPSISHQNITYVPPKTNYRAEYGYSIKSTQEYSNDNQFSGEICKITSIPSADSSNLDWFIDDKYVGSGKNVFVESPNYAQVQAKVNINSITKSDKYVWRKYCCAKNKNECIKFCYSCDYDSTYYGTDSILLTDIAFVSVFSHNAFAEFTLFDSYLNTSKGVLEKDDLTSIIINTNNSSFEFNQFSYSASFSKKPYNFIQLIAENKSSQSIKNLIVSNKNIYLANSQTCTITYFDFFNEYTKPCSIKLNQSEEKIQVSKKQNSNLDLLFKLIIFIFIIYLIYRFVKHYWNKSIISLTCLLLLVPSALADDCGLTNLAECIPQKIYEFFLNLLNSPLEPLLNLVKTLLSSSPDISLFQGVWIAVVYCISLFYGVLFVYSGFLFLISSHDPIKREMAKEWLKNTLIMIVLVQASFYLYGLFVDLGSIMSGSVISMIDTHFFMITADNLTNLGLEFLFVLIYVLILVITLLLLTIRYLVVAFGVLFVPIGVFCYHIPPLKSYGKLILHILGMLIFVTFLDALIILACSKLIEVSIFQNIKIIVLISCFAIINVLFVMLVKHIIHKTSLDDGAEKITQAVKYIGRLV